MNFDEWLDNEERDERNWKIVPENIDIEEYIKLAMKATWDAAIFEASFEHWR